MQIRRRLGVLSVSTQSGRLAGRFPCLSAGQVAMDDKNIHFEIGPEARSDRAPRRALRASDSDRERVVGLLEAGATAGCLTFDELASRTDAAYAATTKGQLHALVADLPGFSDEVLRDRRPDRPRARSGPPPGSAVDRFDRLAWWATGQGIPGSWSWSSAALGAVASGAVLVLPLLAMGFEDPRLLLFAWAVLYAILLVRARLLLRRQRRANDRLAVDRG